MEPLSSEPCSVSMLTQNAGSQNGRPFMAVPETCISAFSCSLTGLHTRKKDNPGKEAYKLAHGHAREQIGAVEVNDKASSSHENQRKRSRVLCDSLT